MRPFLFILVPMSARIVRLALIAAFWLIPAVASAYSGGITNRVTPSTQGCGGGPCHATTASAATIISVEGTRTVAAGQELELTVIVSHPTGKTAGVNIAVRTAINGAVNIGTLVPISGQGLYDSEKELTHSTPKPLDNGSASFRFRWKAPSEPGTYFIHAAANAANGNGVRDRQDIWNLLSPVEIVVTEPTSVSEATPRQATHTIAFPVPSAYRVSVALPLELNGQLRVVISAVSGDIVYTGVHDPASDGHEFTWDGATTEGMPVSSGTYVITLYNDRRSIIAKALLQRQ